MPEVQTCLRQPKSVPCLWPVHAGSPLSTEAARHSGSVRRTGRRPAVDRACAHPAGKTRIAFQVRMSFAQVTPRRRWLDGHVVLARRLEHPRFRSIQTFSPRNHLHTFRVNDLSEVDDELRGWLAEAYAVGAQRHLPSGRAGRSPAGPTAGISGRET